VLIDDKDIPVWREEGWISYASFIEKIERILEGKKRIKKEGISNPPGQLSCTLQHH